MKISFLLSVRHLYHVYLHVANECLKHVLFTKTLASEIYCCSENQTFFCFICDIICFCKISFGHRLYKVVSSRTSSSYLIFFDMCCFCNKLICLSRKCVSNLNVQIEHNLRTEVMKCVCSCVHNLETSLPKNIVLALQLCPSEVSLTSGLNCTWTVDGLQSRSQVHTYCAAGNIAA
jgi:hypothetical protein